MNIKITKSKLNLNFYYLIFIFISYQYARVLVNALIKNKMVTLKTLIILPILLIIVTLLLQRKISAFQLFCFIVLIFWLPYQLGTEYFGKLGLNFQQVELGIYFIFAFILLSSRFASESRLAEVMRNFPLAQFLLYITGAIIAFLYGVIYLHVFHQASIIRLRVLCIYPLVLCLICVYLINSIEKARKLIWIFLCSSFFLGIIFLFGRKVTEIVSLSSYAASSGRLSMRVQVPLLGGIEILPAQSSALFSMCFTIAFCFWLNEKSNKKRYSLLAIMVISIMVMVRSQGRAGIIASILSSVVIWYLSGYSRLSSARLNFIKMLFFIIIVLGATYYLANISPYKTYRAHGLEIFSNPLASKTFVSRNEIWEEAIPVFIKHPFGMGANGLIAVNVTTRELTNPLGDIWGVHNLILYLLFFSGFIGTIGFLLIFVWFIRRCISKLRYKDPAIRLFSIAGIGITTAFFTCGVTSPVINSSWDASFLWMPVGIIMAVLSLPDKVIKTYNNK